MKKILVAAMLLLPLATTASARWGPSDCYGDYTWSSWKGRCVFSQKLKDDRIQARWDQFFGYPPSAEQLAAKHKEEDKAFAHNLMVIGVVSLGITSAILVANTNNKG